ncbi:hypothetical protein MTO96_004127 [Rhipicephalus appendiculatus]
MALFFPRRLAAADLLTSEYFDCQEGFGDGVFQWRLLMLCTVAIFLINGQVVLIPAVSSDVDHWCKRPAGSNISADAWKDVAIPVGADGRHSRCERIRELWRLAERHIGCSQVLRVGLRPSASFHIAN